MNGLLIIIGKSNTNNIQIWYCEFNTYFKAKKPSLRHPAPSPLLNEFLTLIFVLMDFIKPNLMLKYTLITNNFVFRRFLKNYVKIKDFVSRIHMYIKFQKSKKPLLKFSHIFSLLRTFNPSLINLYSNMYSINKTNIIK